MINFYLVIGYSKKELLWGGYLYLRNLRWNQEPLFGIWIYANPLLSCWALNYFLVIHTRQIKRKIGPGFFKAGARESWAGHLEEKLFGFQGRLLTALSQHRRLVRGDKLQLTQKGINSSPFFLQREEISAGMLAVWDAEKSLEISACRDLRCAHLLAVGWEERTQQVLWKSGSHYY